MDTTDEDTLFDFSILVEEDVESPSTTIIKRDSKNSLAEKAWKKWCEITERHDCLDMPIEFQRSYTSLLRKNYSHNELMKWVDIASYTPRRNRDPLDIRRLLWVLERPEIRNQALSLAVSEGQRRYLWDDTDPNEEVADIRYLEQLCGVSVEDWTYNDNDVSVKIARLPNLEEVVDIVKSRLGLHMVSPYDIFQEMKAKDFYDEMGQTEETEKQARISIKRSMYNSGAFERSFLLSINTYADPACENAIMRGVSSNIIADYHNLAPEGFWERVEDIADEQDISIKDAQIIAGKEFGWNPSTRGTIHEFAKRHQ